MISLINHELQIKRLVDHMVNQISPPIFRAGSVIKSCGCMKARMEAACIEVMQVKMLGCFSFYC